MGSIFSPELGLDLRSIFVPKTIGDILTESTAIGNVAERASNLESYVRRLEEEMKKIDAFKRELPLCMLLLKDAIVYMKEESAKLEVQKPVLEEFMPLKNDEEKEEGLDCEEKKEKDSKDKKNWMSSVQLWNSDDDHSNIISQSHKPNEIRHGINGAFAPFKPYSIGFSVASEEREKIPIRGLSLMKALKEEPNHIQNHHYQTSSAAAAAARKQRRCWSPELHRRFVSALQQLGGSQVATPKQIRELMQVDGLTNDEVKSHLQKYRLHTRRVSSGSAAVSQTGSLWTSHEHYGESSKSSSQSGSPQGPFQLGPIGSGSPTTGDESLDDNEEVHDAKSEGYSWKVHNSNNKLVKKDDV